MRWRHDDPMHSGTTRPMNPAGDSIRVLHVVDSLAPGGLENGIVNVARRLHGDGFEIGVACLRFRGDFAERMPDPARVVVMGKTDGFSREAVRALRRHLRESRAHVVHTHNLGTLIYGALATHGGRTHPIIHGEHGQLQRDELSAKRILQYRLLYPLCHRVHAVSAGVRDQLRGLGLDRRGKILVTLNGVDCERFRPAAEPGPSKEAIGLPGNALVVGIVGRLVALKRHRLLFEAFARLAPEFPDLHLLVVGDGGADRESIIGEMRRHPRADRLHWAGHRDDLERYYPAMDLLAAPSEIEGLSNAVLEAMACAVPVLGHRACGNSEVIRHGEDGFLEEIRDADSLVSILRSLLSDRDRVRRCGTAARETVAARFSMDSMARDYRNLYLRARGRPDFS
jgi:glycosyltransferase involved in cell wall biosynthesis